jgi:hypothetical protein
MMRSPVAVGEAATVVAAAVCVPGASTAVAREPPMCGVAGSPEVQLPDVDTPVVQ